MQKPVDVTTPSAISRQLTRDLFMKVTLAIAGLTTAQRDYYLIVMLYRYWILSAFIQFKKLTSDRNNNRIRAIFRYSVSLEARNPYEPAQVPIR